MSRSKRFQPIVDHAHRLEQEAAKALGEAQHKVEAAIHRHEELVHYQGEYHERLKEMGTEGANPRRIRDYHAFLEKLKQAIAQQVQVIQQCQAELEACKQYWFSQRGRTKALDGVLDRYVRQEEAAEEKKLQREVDDRFRRSSDD